MNTQLVLAVLGAILAVAGALGIAYAVFRSATVQKTLDLYRSENEALGKAVARLQGDYLTIVAKAEELERANRVLQETVSGREAIQALATHLSKEQQARSDEHRVLAQLLEDMKDQLADIWQGVVRVLGERDVR